MALNKIIIYLSLLLFTAGEPLSCQDGALLAIDGLHCECLDGSFYNAVEGKCQGICEYFTDNLCILEYDHKACMQDPFNATNYECWCPPGYEEIDTLCVDIDECDENATLTLSCAEPEHEICYNVEGEDFCDCMTYYFRNDEDNCKEIDLCNMPDVLSPCEQGCNLYPVNDSSSCYCYEGFTLNSTDNLCYIDTFNGYTDCECEVNNPQYGDCSLASDGTQMCYPKPGYKFTDDNLSIEDINECRAKTYQCPLGSECVNDNGGYHCDCWPGYSQIDDDFVLDGCEPMHCDDGMIIYEGECVDPCEGPDVICPTMSVCLTDENNVPQCSCQVECQNSGLPSSSTFSIYSLSIYLPYENASDFMYSQKQYLLTNSMESIFGKGNAEIIEISIFEDGVGAGITLEIGVPMPLDTPSVIGDVIFKNCWLLGQISSDPQCILPGGMILDKFSVNVSEINRCDNSTLCENNTNSVCVDSDVSSGRYWCMCLEGFERVDAYDAYCEDINECITGDDNCEEGMVCVNDIGNYSCEYDSDYLTTLQYLVDDANEDVVAGEEIVDELNQNLDDQRNQTKKIGASTGGAFGVIFIILSIALVYISRTRQRKKKSSEKGARRRKESSSSEEEVEAAPSDPSSVPPSLEPLEIAPASSGPSPGPSDPSPDSSNTSLESLEPSPGPSDP